MGLRESGNNWRIICPDDLSVRAHVAYARHPRISSPLGEPVFLDPKTVVALAPQALNPLNPVIAHGPETLMGPIQAAQSLLHPGECVELANMRWHRSTKTQLLKVYASVDPDFRSEEEGSANMSGSFTTTKGRVIRIEAHQKGRRISDTLPENPISRLLVDKSRNP